MAYKLKHGSKKYKDAGFDVRWLRANPEIAKVADAYVSSRNSDAPWSIERLQQELEQTRWWSKRTESQRRWDQLKQTQPGQAKQEVSDAKRQVQEFAKLLGIKINNKQANRLAQRAARNQWDEADYRYAIADTAGTIGPDGVIGDTRNAMAQFQAWQEQYLVKASQEQMSKWALQVARGQRTVDDFQDWYRTRAEKMYKGISDDLASGLTTQEVLDPYMQIAREELGVNPANVNLFDSKWTAALTGSSGEPMTAEEWTAKIRTDHRYGWDKTIKAQNEAAELGNQVLQLFGMR